MKPFFVSSAALLFSCTQVLPSAVAQDWTGHMGPGNTGTTSAKIDATVVSAKDGPPLRWRLPVGISGASPVVAGDSVFAFGGFLAGTDPKDPGAAIAGTPKSQAIGTQWIKTADGTNFAKLDVWATCADLKTGAVKWRTKLRDAEPINAQQQLYASPLWADGRVYFRSPRFVSALDAKTGALLWQRDLVIDFNAAYAVNQTYSGFLDGRSAPLFVNGKVLVGYLETSNPKTAADKIERYDEKAALAAFDPATGKTLWAKPVASRYSRWYDAKNESSETGYASGFSPAVAGVVDGKMTVVISTGHATLGVDPDTGERRWIFHHVEQFDDLKKYINDQDGTKRDNFWPWWAGYGYASGGAVVSDGVVIDRMFLGHGTNGTRTYAFSVQNGQPKLLWQTPELATRCQRLVVQNGRVYGTDHYGHLHTRDNNTGVVREWPRPPRADATKQLQCRDLKTGQLLWSSDDLWQGDSREPTYICENKNNPKFVTPCEALDERTRGRKDEGSYPYTGDPALVVAGDILVMKGARPNFTGLAFARLQPNGMQVLNRRAFSLGFNQFGEPVVANGALLLKLDSEEAKDLPGTGNLLCFSLAP